MDPEICIITGCGGSSFMALSAKLQLVINVRAGISYAESEYFTPPLKILPVRETRNDPFLIMILMSSSPGILDGDDICINIRLKKGSSLSFETQSFQRIFTMKNAAKQFTEIRLEENCCFSFIPHPVVPHKDSSFTSHSAIYLEPGCTIIWGEVLTCGRIRNNEVFDFRRLHAVTEFYFQEKLFLRENMLMLPEAGNIQNIGMLEGYTHQASFIYYGNATTLTELMDEVYKSLSDIDTIDFGLTRLNAPGFLVRILGSKAELLFDILKKLETMIKQKMQDLKYVS